MSDAADDVARALFGAREPKTLPRWDAERGYFVDACGGCGHEWPVREGYLESCVSAKGGGLVLQLCPDCRKTLTVQEALDKLESRVTVQRVPLWVTIRDLLRRVEELERR